jgi:hypothetical protein
LVDANSRNRKTNSYDENNVKMQMLQPIQIEWRNTTEIAVKAMIVDQDYLTLCLLLLSQVTMKYLEIRSLKIAVIQQRG